MSSPAGQTVRSVSLREAVPLIRDYVAAGIVPHLWGPPGCGKSSIVQQLAESKELKLIDMRASTFTPSDLGIPDRVLHKNSTLEEEYRIAFIPPEDFPLDTDTPPINPATGKPFRGWILFLDEFLSAPEEVQAAFFKVILDRMVGNRHIHKNVIIIAASNREEDGGLVNPMLTPMKTRMGHLNIKSVAQNWVEDFASTVEGGVHPAVTGFILNNPSKINVLEVTDSQTFPCERTWAMASRYLRHKDTQGANFESAELLTGVAGIIGTSTATELMAFNRYFKDLTPIADVIRDPKNAAMPSQEDYQFAMLAMVADAYPTSAAEYEDIPGGDTAEMQFKSTSRALMTYVKRFTRDKQVLAIKLMLGPIPKASLSNHTEIVKWVHENSAIFSL